MFTSNFNKKPKSWFHWITISIIAIIVIAIIGQGVLLQKGYTQVSMPDYSGDGGQTWMTKEYSEHEGCIDFKDNFGMQHHLCGNYQLTKF